jgi:hypothetical protein
MTIPEKILWVRSRRKWNQKAFGGALPGAVKGWQVSRWERGVEEPSRRRCEQIDELLFKTYAADFGGGFRYVCNLGERYGHRFATRQDDAIARLRRALIDAPPAPSVGALTIVVLKADLPEGVRAQCFSSVEPEPRGFIILVRPDVNWMDHAREEVFAHVLSYRPPADALATPD